MPDKTQLEEKTKQLIEMTAGFCDKHANAEYKQLCEKLIRKMSRKRNVPFLSGHMEIWAAATVYALGSINFLFDKSFEPYASPDDIVAYFGTVKSTTASKAKVIRDMFKLGYFDEEFSTAHMKESNPLANMVMINGFIVDIRNLPPEMQEEVRRRQGL